MLTLLDHCHAKSISDYAYAQQFLLKILTVINKIHRKCQVSCLTSVWEPQISTYMICFHSIFGHVWLCVSVYHLFKDHIPHRSLVKVKGERSEIRVIKLNSFNLMQVMWSDTVHMIWKPRGWHYASIHWFTQFNVGHMIAVPRGSHDIQPGIWIKSDSSSFLTTQYYFVLMEN